MKRPSNSIDSLSVFIMILSIFFCVEQSLLASSCYAFEMINPYPFNTVISDMWGTGPDNIYYAGWEFIGHWDGSQYSTIDTSKEFPYRCWNGIYGISDDDIMVVGGLGNALHWDGLTWTNVSIPGCNNDFYSVWGAETGEYFVASDNGLVWKYFDSNWYVIVVNSCVFGFYDIWGFSADDIYIAGVAALGDEAIYHWDGVDWTPFGGDTRGWEIYTLKVFSSNDMWVAGDGGQILHWDGTSWLRHYPGDPLYNLYT